MTEGMTDLPLPSKQYTHILHISDLHFGAKVSKDEFLHAFGKLKRFVQKWEFKDTAICVVTGDVFHHHAREHADIYCLAKECMMDIMEQLPTVMIRGNHDIDIHAPNKSDAISAAFMGNRHNDGDDYLFIHPCAVLLKKTGLFRVGNIWFGCLDVLDASCEGCAKMPPAPRKGEKEVRIALCHATLRHSKFFASEAYQESYMSCNVFDGYDAVLLGDVHKRQVLDGRPIAYPGSLLQLSYGEDPDGHGAAIWDIQGDLPNPKVSFLEIPPLVPKYNIVVRNGRPMWKLWSMGRKLQDMSTIPNKSSRSHVKLHILPDTPLKEVERLKQLVLSYFENEKVEELIQAIVPTTTTSSDNLESEASIENENENEGVSGSLVKIPDLYDQYRVMFPERGEEAKLLQDPVQNLFTYDSESEKVLTEWCQPNANRSHREVAKKLKELVSAVCKDREQRSDKRHYVQFTKLRWSNLSCFAEDNELDLSKKGIYGILGAVYSGKSSILDILMLALYRRPMRQQDGARSNSNHFQYFKRCSAAGYSVVLELLVDNNCYVIERSCKDMKSKKGSVDRLAMIVGHGKKEEEVLAINAKEVDAWVQENIGDMPGLLASILMSQKNQSSFVHLTPQQQMEQIQSWLQLDQMMTLYA